jgi:hypothetical protein
MTQTVNLTIAAKTARAAALVASVGTSGTLNLYSGSIPASADTALSGNTLLAQFHGNATAFGVASSGVTTLNLLTDTNNQVNASNTGTVTFCRVENSSNVAIVDLGVATSGEAITVNTTSIVSGGPIQLATGGTFTEN